MAKWFQQNSNGKNFEGKLLENIKEKIKGKNMVCSILITCSEPSDDGDMQVEMSYDGDRYLVSYLVKSAAEFIEEELEIS